MAHHISDLRHGINFLTIESHHIEEARDHISDCQWADLEDDDIKNLTDSEIINGISKHYSGGWPQFLDDSAYGWLRE